MDGAPSSIPSSPSLAVHNTHESLGYRRRSHPTSVLPASPTPQTTIRDETRVVHEIDDDDRDNSDDGGTDILARYFDRYDAADDTGLTNLPSEPSEPNELGTKKFKPGDQTTQVYADVAEFRASSRRHGSIGEYSRVPLLGAKTRKYYELLPAEPTAQESRQEFWRRNYTQVLIWCLQKRIERLELARSRAKEPSSAQLQTLGALKALQNSLSSERSVVDWSDRPATLDESVAVPKPNPDNLLNAQRVHRARVALDRMNEKSREWLELLKTAERSTKLRPFKIDNPPITPAPPLEAVVSAAAELQLLREELFYLDAVGAEARASLGETLAFHTSRVAQSRTMKLLGSRP